MSYETPSTFTKNQANPEKTAMFAWAEELTEDELQAATKRLQERADTGFEAIQAASRPAIPAYFGTSALRRKLIVSRLRNRSHRG